MHATSLSGGHARTHTHILTNTFLKTISRNEVLGRQAPDLKIGLHVCHFTVHTYLHM